jgi:hypothetical protein
MAIITVMPTTALMPSAATATTVIAGLDPAIAPNRHIATAIGATQPEPAPRRGNQHTEWLYKCIHLTQPHPDHDGR